MECRITVLCENTVQGLGFLGEHGFSAFIETPGQNILFDTGQGFSLIQNSLRLKKDLRQVSKVVLSHGHLDHVGGLLAFLGVKGACPVAAHPDMFNERFWLMPVAERRGKTRIYRHAMASGISYDPGGAIRMAPGFHGSRAGRFPNRRSTEENTFRTWISQICSPSGRRLDSGSFSR